MSKVLVSVRIGDDRDSTFKKDSLWEIVANIKLTEKELNDFQSYLIYHAVPFNLIKLYGVNILDGKIHYTAHIYSENQFVSTKVKQLLDKYNAKYIVHEERVKL